MTTVLIIDDDQVDRMFMTASFRKVAPDLNIVECSHSGEAADMFRELAPAATLIDINMPPPNGFELLTELRGLPGGADALIYLLSGSTDPKDREQAQSLGATDYFSKPSTREEYNALAAAVTELVKG